MPRYKRYGYVTTHLIQSFSGRLDSYAVVDFQLNPKVANENLDTILRSQFDDPTTKKVDNTTGLALSGFNGETIRSVLIEHPSEGMWHEFFIQRWAVEVGRE
jgi:hypothetical protein